MARKEIGKTIAIAATAQLSEKQIADFATENHCKRGEAVLMLKRQMQKGLAHTSDIKLNESDRNALRV